ncbi:MAG TPA: DUF4922 domain-containing protein [Ignavibacteriaceae bacterium]|nr:DUF4922 domain-containing protein [Ignavibacteriaceae bacterium]
MVPENNFADKSKNLLSTQLKNWQMCKDGYATLNSIQVKTFNFDGYTIKVQYNAGRLISSGAKVDAKSIKERPCFLCLHNLPKEQQVLDYKENYAILVNPFPIFNEHFTLPNKEHVPQSIKESFKILLHYSRDLSNYYTVFYNGPKCGASAPDHQHFQAGNKDFMPIDHEYDEIISRYGKALVDNDTIKILSVDDGLRKFISFEGSDEDALDKYFQKLLTTLKKLNNSEEEPLLNILSFYHNEKWRVIIFLREKHRPTQYFAEDDSRILLSPASVDIGGVSITPLKEDFDKITKEDIVDIFHQVFISKDKLEKVFRVC